MIDLTPLDVRKKRGDFRRILRGYDPGEVDTFLEAVEGRMEALVMENLSMTEKIHRLASQLEALEGREKAVQEALVTAQKLREDVQDQSQREATSLRDQAFRETESLRAQVKRETESLRGEAHREASILRDEAIREAASVRDQARREAELLRREVTGEIEARILEAEGLIKERQRALEDLERSRRKFLKGFKSLLEREMDSVEVEEARRPLEDTPLELNLKGWPPGGEEVDIEALAPEALESEESGSEETFGAAEAADDAPSDAPSEAPSEGSVDASALLGDASLEAFEPVFDLDATEAGGEPERSPTQGWGAMPGDEPPQGEFSDIVPVGVFDPPSVNESASEPDDGSDAIPSDLSGDGEPPDGAEPGVVDAEFGMTVKQLLDRDSGKGGPVGPEPLWLSSLLKQEGVSEDGGGMEVVEEPSLGGSEPDPFSVGELGAVDEEDEPRID